MPDFEPACPLSAFSSTNSVVDWFTSSRKPRILHVFDRACNLINEHGDVLSIVTQQIGNGPFNLVVKDDIHFDEHFTLEIPVTMHDGFLHVGNIMIDVIKAKHWDAHPPWEKLHRQRASISAHLSHLRFADSHLSLPQLPVSTFAASLAIADLPSCLTVARQLAGLGQGLTPSGDDFIMGAMYAAWIIHPIEIASNLAHKVADCAAPLTTSISGAWIRSAGRGDAGILWHELFDAMLLGENIDLPISNILAVGATSGADTLAGFFRVLSAYREYIISECPS